MTFSGRAEVADVAIEAEAGVFTDTMGPSWFVQPTTRTVPSTRRPRTTAAPAGAMLRERVGGFIFISNGSATEIRVADAAPADRTENGLLLYLAGLAQVDNSVPGVESLREAGSRGLAETAVHLQSLLVLKGV